MTQSLSLPFRRPFLFVLFLMAASATGCARLPVDEPLPSDLEVSPLARVLPGAPFAWAPDGKRIALVDRHGLKVRDVTTGRERLLDKRRPAALEWDRDTGRLAGSFVEEERSRLRIYHDGQVEKEIDLPGSVHHIAWRNSREVVAYGVEVERYSFGANFKQVLYRWPLTGTAGITPLHDVTVKPLTLQRWGDRLMEFSRMELSPWGDEIVYLRLHDPPEFAPYFSVVLRHLESGTERVLGQSGLPTAGAIFSSLGEEVLFSGGTGALLWVDPWGKKEEPTAGSAMRSLSRSRSGEHLWADGRLYHLGRELAAFPGAGKARFAPGGDRLAIRHEDRLYLLQGLAPGEAVNLAEGEERESVLRLRLLRSRGLITQEEFLQQRRKMDEP